MRACAQDVDLMLRDVAAEVLDATGSKQDPYHSHNLKRRNVCLVPAPAAAAAAAATAAAPGRSAAPAAPELKTFLQGCGFGPADVEAGRRDSDPRNTPGSNVHSSTPERHLIT
jgi:hypothetical protein